MGENPISTNPSKGLRKLINAFHLIPKNNGSLRDQLLKGGVGSFAIIAFNTFLGFILVVLLARLLGPEGFGVYTYAITLISFIAIPAQLGLPNLVIRETAKFHATENWVAIKGIWKWASMAAIALSFLLMTGSFLFTRLFEKHLSEIQANIFIWGLMLVPLIALSNLRSASIRGLRKIVLGQLPDSVFQPGIFILLILLCWALFSKAWLDAIHVMYIHILSVSLVLIIGTYILSRIKPVELLGVRPHYENRQWITSALPLAMIAGTQLVHKNTDILVLGLFLKADDVGTYRVAAQGAMIASFGISAVTMVIAPHLANLYSLGKLNKMQKILTVSARWSLALAVFITLAALFFGKWAIEIIFGKEFLDAYVPLIILCVGQIITVILGSSVTLASMTGHEKICAKILMQGAVINIAINLALIPQLGMEGAALATVISLLIWRTMLFLKLKKLTGLNTTVFSGKYLQESSK